MLRIALLLLSVASFAAEPAKSQELTLKSTSLAGKESHLVATLPAVLKGEVKVLPKFGSNLESLRVESTN